MNRMVLNHLIFEAYESTTYAFATQLNIDLHESIVLQRLDPSVIVGLSSIQFRRKVKDLIYSGEIEKVIELISWERPELLEKDEYLYFRLLLLNLIEIIRRNFKEKRAADVQTTKVDSQVQDTFILKVIDFIKLKLLKKVINNHKFMRQLELAMTLLLYCGNGDQEGDQEQSKVEIPEKLSKLFKFQVKRNVFELVNKKIIISDSKKGDTSTEYNDFDDQDDDLDFEIEDSEGIQAPSAIIKGSSYKETKKPDANHHDGDEEAEGEDEYGEERYQDTELLMTDSDMKKMVKLWMWLENNINDESSGSKGEFKFSEHRISEDGDEDDEDEELED
ncbi:hypothetical protein WICPIJ_007628 [Wickerhamomyces pijperi]|uniref:CTLH domain-containing protein n=1 Tax=Wickerhamomyces pijperi TaxID=599730 RepID=A0A9P8Q062_WICPI|nr:hypothetical protein WICPIJ_007628 [Wickerhamomyces pijperi]